MNLLQDKWITVIRKNGETEKIAPYQITDQIDSNPIVEIITPRPDFKGALYQFLIGLFQTVYAPKNETEWEDNFNTPPSTEELKKETDKVAFVFELFGEKIRFMQDISIKDEESLDMKWLLLDCNEDFFNKREFVENACNCCSAMALLTAQINSPAGGSGHRTSIRGGGPLTTILKFKSNEMSETLWRNIYINVLPYHSNVIKLEKIFLWIDSIKLISILTNPITMSEFDELHCFWAIPKRIYLLEEKLTDKISCDICGEIIDTTITKYISKNKGGNYDKTWIHNLSPYRKDDNNDFSAFLCKDDSMLYNNWLTLFSASEKSQPAKVIRYYYESRKLESEQAIIYSFGYNMKPGQAKAKCWYESIIPIYRIEPKYIEKYEIILSAILQTATQVAYYLQTKVKDAWFNEGAKPRGDFDYLKINFFKVTESKFFEVAKSIRDNLKTENPFPDNKKQEWIEYLNAESLKIFDLYVESGSIEFENIQRIVEARQGIKPSQNGKPAKIGLIPSNLGYQIKKIIGLPVIEKTASKKKTAKQGAKRNETI